MSRRIKIAIDGPAGAGKSTVARQVAKLLGYIYIDTGAMYRAITLKALEKNVNLEDSSSLFQLCKDTVITINYDIDGSLQVFLDDRDVSKDIRKPEVSKKVSFVAKEPGVRKEMVRLQRQMAEKGGIVMDGRDIGTYVLPDAELKIYLTATVEERARRRYLELKSQGYQVNLSDLEKEIAERDKRDSEREMAPLAKADDALEIDSSNMSIEEVVNKIIGLARERCRE